MDLRSVRMKGGLVNAECIFLNRMLYCCFNLFLFVGIPSSASSRLCSIRRNNFTAFDIGMNFRNIFCGLVCRMHREMMSTLAYTRVKFYSLSMLLRNGTLYLFYFRYLHLFEL